MTSRYLAGYAILLTLLIGSISLAAIVSDHQISHASIMEPVVSGTVQAASVAVEPQVVAVESESEVETPVLMVWRDAKTGKYISRTLKESEIPLAAK